MTFQRFRFGLFEFDLASKELRREGTVVRLQGQPAQVLACLLEHAGSVVSREDLRQTVWRDDTFVDFERGLNFCIAQIRAALDDAAASPRFIRTIPKRGYQFIAPADGAGDHRFREHPEVVPAADLAAPGSHGFSLGLAAVTAGRIVAAVAALVVVFAAGYWFRSRVTAHPNPIVAVVRFDNETGDPATTRFSDGLTDAVVADLTRAGDGHYRVIGNAKILRGAREQRDLRAIASSLGASYVILGQVQLNGDRTRVLAHLIHLPEQTHVWVARVDRSLDDPLAFESRVTQAVTSQFSPRIAAGVTSRASQPSVTH